MLTNDERRGGGTSLRLVGREQFRTGGGNCHTDDKDTTNVEDDNTPESTTNGYGDVPPWILSFTNGDTNQLGSDVGEHGIGHDGPETEEDGSRVIMNHFLEVSSHRSVGVMPVTEADTIVLGVSTKIDNQTHEQQANEGEYFDTEFQIVNNRLPTLNTKLTRRTKTRVHRKHERPED